MTKRMKKWSFLILICIVMFSCVLFVGCNDEYNSDSSFGYESDYTVSFYTDSIHSFNIPIQVIKYGGFVEKPEDPVKVGYVFVGWYKDIELTVLWRFDEPDADKVTENLTLYAKWVERV